MILEGLDKKGQNDFLQSDELRNLVFLEPKIMNHGTLRRKGYRPDVEMEPDLVKDASEEHHKLKIAYEDYLSQSDEKIEQRVLKRATELLYIVRSNIAHGEKTPYGPDFKKIERDGNVCRVVIPLQQLLLNVLLDYPDPKLVVYGTLASGDVNHSIISDIRGIWEDCTVNGRVNKINELPVFVWEPNGHSLKTQLFSACDLPELWDRLDQFEGLDYRRILVPVIKSTGIGIANCYAGAQN